MMRPTVITRQQGAKVGHYYAGGADDYYAKDGTAMQWQGKGAEALGLTGAIDPTRFRQLLSGTIDKQTHLRRAANGDVNKERLACDLTFSAPKGVSLQGLVHGDARVVAAHNAAVTAALQEAEGLARARVTVRGKTRVEDTGNLVVAKFRHETSREQEPDLHTHAVVLNMTQRRDGGWRALTNDPLFRQQRHIDNVYKAELAKGLEAAGFQLHYRPDGNFDMAHFTSEQVAAFSTRKQQIDDHLAGRGLTRETANAMQKQAASLMTRKGKHEIDRAALQREWQQRAGGLGIDFESRTWAGEGAGGKPSKEDLRPVTDIADEAVRFAVSSLTEREAIVGQRPVIDTALKHGLGRLGIGDVRRALARAESRGYLLRGEQLYTSTNDKDRRPVAMSRDRWIDRVEKIGRSHDQAATTVDQGIAEGRLKRSQIRYTTQVARQREQAILRMEREGRGAVRPQVKEKAAERFLANRGLTDEQAQAARMIATARNRYIGVQGFAGVGKSHMTLAAKDLLEAEGYRVTSLAPYGSQKKDLQALGMESRTVASFLKARNKKIDAKTVVILDEAGVVPARQMQEVMQAIETHGARAVFLGDTAQTQAIEAGRPFAQLQVGGMETSRLTRIQRQKNPELLLAVQLAAEGKTKESVPHVSRIEEVKKPESRYAAVVSDYGRLSSEDRKATLVITGTNESRKTLNEGIRRELGLEGTGRTFELLNRLDTTQAERRASRYYEAGNIVVPERTYKNGLERGHQYRVLDTGPGNNLTVQAEDGKTIQFSPARYKQLSAYQREKYEVAPGDRIRITRNDAKTDLANRDQFTVTAVTERHIMAHGGDGRDVVLDASHPIFADLAYVSTVHSAQGLTADRVLMNVDTKSRTTSKDVYYVGISRARHEAVIYTDDGKTLAAAVSREHRKTAALDLVRYRPDGRDVDREKQHDRRAPEREQRQHEPLERTVFSAP